jgi:hypothetical protein
MLIVLQKNTFVDRRETGGLDAVRIFTLDVKE